MHTLSKLDYKNKSHLLIHGHKLWQLVHILIIYSKLVTFILLYSYKKIEDLLWDYSSEIWYKCGDKSTDYNHYTKRILFNSVYAST